MACLNPGERGLTRSGVVGPAGLLLGAAALVATLVAGGCSSGATGPDAAAEMGPTGFDLPDFDRADIGSWPDGGGLDVPLDRAGRDPAGDTGPGEGGLSDGGTTDLGGPDMRGAGCVPGCDAGRRCLERDTGFQCVTELVLTNNADQNLALLAEAANQCWRYQQDHNGDNVLCYVLDTQSAPTDITGSQEDDWVCNTANASDFPDGQSGLDLAHDLSGCGGILDADNTDFKNDVSRGTTAELCIVFDNFLTDEIQFGLCHNFGAGDYPPAAF